MRDLVKYSSLSNARRIVIGSFACAALACGLITPIAGGSSQVHGRPTATRVREDPRRRCSGSWRGHGHERRTETCRTPRIDPLVDLPVSFNVRNVNRALAPCSSDGAAYTIRGHLDATRSALTAASRGGSSVALYLHGSLIGEDVWRMPLSGTSWVHALASAGHISVTIDQLGFGASGAPDGLSVCFGSWADTAHQVISALRSGSYTLASRARAPRFARVALVSYCMGGLIAQIEAYSFKDIDAYVMLSSAFDQGFSSASTADIFTNPNGPATVCSEGGHPKYPGGPPHYAYVYKGTEAKEWFFNADPSIIQAVIKAHELEPCSEGPDLALALAADRQHMSEITVPVLLVFGEDDAIFPPPDGQRQAALFTGSKDVKLIEVPGSGHALQLGRTAPSVRADVARWLSDHRF